MTFAGRTFTDIYNEGVDSLLHHFRMREDIVTCWNYGKISEPGVSDLDLIAVLKDEPDEGIASYLAVKSLPPRIRELMANANMIIVPESGSYGVFYWDDIKIRDMKSNAPVDDSHLQINVKQRRMAMLVDWSFERIYRVCQLKNTGHKDARQILGLLKSFMYCLVNFKCLFPEVPVEGVEEMRGELFGVRSKFIQSTPEENMKSIELLIEGFYNLANRFGAALFSSLSSCAAYPDNGLCPRRDIGFSFPDGMNWIFVDHYDESRAGHPEVQVPRCLLMHYGAYLCVDGRLSELIRASFHGVDDFGYAESFVENTEYGSFLKRRMDYCLQWYDFLNKNDFAYGMYKFGWYLNK